MALRMALLGILLPAVVSGSVLAILGGIWRRQSAAGQSPMKGWAGAVGLAAGYAAGQIALAGWPGFPPSVSFGWLFYLAAAGVLVAWVARRGTTAGPWLRTVPRVAWALVFVWALTRPLAWSRWGALESLAWYGGTAAVFLMSWASLQRIGDWGAAGEERESKGFLPLLLLFSSAGGAVVLVFSGSALLGLLAGAAAAALGAQMALSRIRPVGGWATWTAPVVLVLLLGAWLEGLLYASLHPVAALFLVLSLQGGWLPRLGGSPEAAVGWKRATCLLLGVGSCQAAAVIAAYYTTPPLMY